MRKRSWLFFVLMLMILVNFSPLVSAQPIINIQIKDFFITGDTLYFNYTVTSETGGEITFVPHIICPNAPVSSLEQKTITIQPGEIYSDVYYDFTVTEEIEPQTCTAYVQVLEPFQYRVEKEFRIETRPSFEFEIFVCKDQACSEKTKVFLQNETIYLDYSSGVENPEIDATLIYPSGREEQITLPTSIKLDEVGTYTLTVTASKEGYKNVTKTVQFAVIEKEPEFEVLTTTTSLPSTTTTVPSTSTLETVTTTETQPIRFPKLSPALIGLIGAIVSVVIIVLVVYVVVRG